MPFVSLGVSLRPEPPGKGTLYGAACSRYVLSMVEKRAAIYVRVSTGTQTTENQLRRPEDVAARAGSELVQIAELQPRDQETSALGRRCSMALAGSCCSTKSGLNGG